MRFAHLAKNNIRGYRNTIVPQQLLLLLPLLAQMRLYLTLNARSSGWVRSTPTTDCTPLVS